MNRWKDLVVGAALGVLAMNARDCASPALARDYGDLQSVVDQLKGIARAIERQGERCR
jgi:hypothetical protein